MRTRIQRTLALLAGGVLGLSAAGCSRSPQSSAGAEPAAVPPTPSAPLTARAAELDTRTRGWELGKRYAYDLMLATKVAFAGGPDSFDFELRGRASVTPVLVEPEVVTLYLHVADASVVSHLKTPQPELEQTAADMRAHGVFFTLSHGLVTELRVPAGQTPMATSSYRQLASALQFAHAKGNDAEYTAEEYDTSGRYVAAYKRIGEATFSKQKPKYLSILGSANVAGMQRAPIVPEVDSKCEVHLSAEGRPERVKLDEKLRLNGDTVPIRSSLKLELRQSEGGVTARGAEDWDSLLANTGPLAASDAIGHAVPVEALDAARIGKLTFPEVLTRLEQIARKEQAVQAAHAKDAPTDPPPDPGVTEREAKLREDSRLFFALSALLRQDAKLAGEAARAIRRKSPAATVLMDALGSASTPEAQAALVAVMRDKTLGSKQTSRATLALLRTPKPDQGSVRALKSLLDKDPFDNYGLYGLGTYSRRFRDAGKTQEAKELGEFVTARLTLAKDATDLGVALRAIANSGYAGALERVEPYLRDRRADVRSAAVSALQSMRDPRVDGLLAASLASDASPDVREAAIAAAKIREPSDAVVEALVRAGQEADDAHVRFRAVDLMIRWMPSRPALRGALQTIAQNDAEARVRERANSAL